jgi:acyl carrier protein
MLPIHTLKQDNITIFSLLPTYFHLMDKHFFVKPHELKSHTHFIKDLGFNSLDFIEMILVVETAFAIEFDNQQIENTKTVADLLAHLESKLAQTLPHFISLNQNQYKKQYS